MHAQRFDARRRWTRAGARALLALLPALLLAAAALPRPTAAATELVVNGGFEEPDVPAGGFQPHTSINGWYTTFGPGIEIQDHAAGLPHTGAQHAELDSTASSGMAQDIATVPGVTYHVSFWVSPRPNRPADDNVLQVTWDGGVLQTIAAGAGGIQTAWVQYAYTVVASSDVTTLAFADVGTSNSFGAYIDDVSVTETTYGVCLLYDPLKPKKAGSVVPIKLQLCDAAYNNVSGPSLVLHAVNVAPVDGTVAAAPVEDAGQANPDHDFRYDPDLAGYIFNLDTNGLSQGTWQVQFTVNGGSHVYAANFDIK